MVALQPDDRESNRGDVRPQQPRRSLSHHVGHVVVRGLVHKSSSVKDGALAGGDELLSVWSSEREDASHNRTDPDDNAASAL